MRLLRTDPPGDGVGGRSLRTDPPGDGVRGPVHTRSCACTRSFGTKHWIVTRRLCAFSFLLFYPVRSAATVCFRSPLGVFFRAAISIQGRTFVCTKSGAITHVDLGDVHVAGPHRVHFSGFGKRRRFEGRTAAVLITWVFLVLRHHPVFRLHGNERSV